MATPQNENDDDDTNPSPYSSYDDDDENARTISDGLRKFFATYFFLHVPATALIDAQALVKDKALIPTFAREILEFHVEQNRDFLMLDPAPWLKSFIFCECFLQLPTLVLLLRKFLRKDGRNVKVIGLCYSSHVMTTMVPILTAIVFNREGGNKDFNWQLFLIYFPYFLVPFMLFVSLLRIPDGGEVFARTTTKTKTKKKL